MNKQTKERNFSFKSLLSGWALHVQNAQSIVGTGYSGFFLNSLDAVIPSFINVTETRTLRCSSLKPRMLWYTSPLSIQPGYSVVNFTEEKMFSGQSRIFCLSASRQKIAASKRKKAERNGTCLFTKAITFDTPASEKMHKDNEEVRMTNLIVTSSQARENQHRSFKVKGLREATTNYLDCKNQEEVYLGKKP